ncbi:uncharacterized protein BDV17DRAFT_252802 [Aspergillus undulatus]|uniref:uncharacterized protein n=1 Tax=Aspergillus undulatus TaxID=1810928 RepID=UPI003CCDFBAC
MAAALASVCKCASASASACSGECKRGFGFGFGGVRARAPLTNSHISPIWPRMLCVGSSSASKCFHSSPRSRINQSILM